MAITFLNVIVLLCPALRLSVVFTPPPATVPLPFEAIHVPVSMLKSYTVDGLSGVAGLSGVVGVFGLFGVVEVSRFVSL